MINYPQKLIKRILCVDDDDDDASLLQSAVNTIDEGIVFVKSFGGKEALQYLKTTDRLPDVILLDVNMPIVNGFECLKEIRRNSALAEIPVIMLSTSASPKDVNMALELGALKFLTKPNTYQEIHFMVHGIITEILVEK